MNESLHCLLSLTGQIRSLFLLNPYEKLKSSQASVSQCSRKNIFFSIFVFQTSRLLHGNQSAQLILSAAFPLQQSTFTQSHHQQHQSQQQQQLSRHRTDKMTDPSKVQPQQCGRCLFLKQTASRGCPTNSCTEATEVTVRRLSSTMVLRSASNFWNLLRKATR